MRSRCCAEPLAKWMRATANCRAFSAFTPSARCASPLFGIVGDEPFGEAEASGILPFETVGDEGALDQFFVARIEAQGLAEESRGCNRIALGTGDDRGEIIARGAVADLERRRYDEIFLSFRGRLRQRGREGQAAQGYRNDRVRCETMRRQARTLQDEWGFGRTRPRDAVCANISITMRLRPDRRATVARLCCELYAETSTL